MPLSDTKIRNLKPKTTTYKVSDGDGLMVVVTPNGNRLWRMKYFHNGKERTISFGPYPVVTLYQARKLRDEAKRKLQMGLDPVAARREVKAAASQPENRPRAITFREIGDRWFKANQDRWVQSYSSRVRARMLDDVYPLIGAKELPCIEPMQVIDLARQIENRGAIEMAKRVVNHVKAVFDFAVAEGAVQRNPARDVGPALARRRAVKHRNAPMAEQVCKLIADIEGDTTVPLALQFTLRTMARTNEVRFARWDEIDGDLWRIPAERMKMRRDHIVPLSRQAAEILARVERKGDLVFLMGKNANGVEKPMSSNAMLYYIYRHGWHGVSTVHGFRTLASTVLNEHEFNRDWIEMQLAHFEDDVRSVYNKAQWLKQRKDMMQWWSDWLDEQRQQSQPVSGDLFADVLG